MIRVITFGTFDLFHIGHLNILSRAGALGDRLIVGVSTDKLNFAKKKVYPVVPEEDRVAIVKALRFVDEVFLEESLELKGEYIRRFRADLLVMGSDWAGKFDQFGDICRVVYLPRTEGISTTEIKTVLSTAPVGARVGAAASKGRKSAVEDVLSRRIVGSENADGVGRTIPTAS